MNEYIAVTISRQMGSGGTYVGYKVAKKLGFTYVDREILRLAAKRLGIVFRPYRQYHQGILLGGA